VTITKSSDINNSNLLVIIIIITLFVQQFHSITNEQVGLQQQSTMLLSSYRKDAREKQKHSGRWHCIQRKGKQKKEKYWNSSALTAQQCAIPSLCRRFNGFGRVLKRAALRTDNLLRGATVCERQLNDLTRLMTMANVKRYNSGARMCPARTSASLYGASYAGSPTVAVWRRGVAMV